MKYIFTLLLLTSFFTSKAQTPQCIEYHGCGGATVVAYRTDATWTSITYDFQRFQGGSWVTIAQSIENFHLVIPGDITVATQYRTILRNNATSEERISNGVTVDPAKFNNSVIPPKPVITFYWGFNNTAGMNYIEVLPKAGDITGMRPPFTYTIKKKNGAVYDQKISTTGIFFTNNIEVNEEYVINVKDYCGQVDSLAGVHSFVCLPRVIARNCSGASIEFSSFANGQNFNLRQPVSFGVAPLADSINVNDVSQSILSTIDYSFSAGVVSGFTGRRYVVRAKDAYGVLSSFSVVSTGLEPNTPFIRTIGPAAGFCNVFVSLDGSYSESGIRRAGDNQSYTFTPSNTITGIRAGYSYEIVGKDSCGRISAPLIQDFAAFAPKITNVNVDYTGCSNTLTITATSCTNNPEYRLQLFGEAPGAWQSSNVFTHVPGNPNEYHKVFVRDGNSSLDSNFVYVAPLSPQVITDADNGLCGSLYYTHISDVNNGKPPYLYAISYDGINFTPFSSNNYFTNLSPGTYDVIVKDSCGSVFRTTEDEQRQAGTWYYANEIGFKTNCTTNAEEAGGFIRFGIQLANTLFTPVAPPYKYVLKEILSNNGGNIQFGNIVRSGETQDTIFTITGLPGDKHYGIFIRNSCGEFFTAKNRTANDYYVPAGVLPEPVIAINSSNCNAPFFEVNNLPNQGSFAVYKGNDTLGTALSLTSTTASNVLTGGYYTIKIATPDYNGCQWQQLYTQFINTTDSTSAGTFNANLGGICKADSSIIELKNYVIGQTPCGLWNGNIPDSNWVNRDSGQFRTTGLQNGIYQFEFSVQSLCGANLQLRFSIPIDLDNCALSASYTDVLSAGSPAGCKNYGGNEWFDVLDQAGRLQYSINPGDGNSLQQVCWGARFRNSGDNPRAIVLNNSPVYFANRNFYIEPNQLTIGVNPVRFRLYYSNDDIAGFLENLRLLGFPLATTNDLRILKKKAGPGSPVDLDVKAEPGTPMSLYTFITPSVYRLGTGPFANWYFEFEVSSFSEMALVYTPGNVLPVSWLSVTGQLSGAKAIIKWATSSESNTKHFEPEHSIDGISYAKIGVVTAAGNSSHVQRYHFVHGLPVSGKNYYRIKQIDLDGRFTYSSIIILQQRDLKMNIIIAPNPTGNETTLYFTEGGTKTLQLLNMNGSVLLTENIGPNSKHSISLANLSAGIYLLRLQTKNGITTHKIVKQ